MLNIIKYHRKFDMIRGISALTVVFAHIIQIYIRRLYSGDQIIFDLSGTLARHAVLIFFLLSGYLITASIIKNINNNQEFNLIEYLSARIVRIYPPLVGAILLILCCWVIIHSFNLPGKFHYGIPTDNLVARDSFSLTLKEILLALAMHNGLLQVDGPLWSLCIEFIIYIIAMFITLAITSKALVKKLVWVMLATLIFIYGNKINIYFLFFTFVWVLGSLTAIAISAGKIQSTIFYGRILFAISVVSLFLVVLENPRLISVQNAEPIFSNTVQILFCFAYTYLIFISKLFDGIKSITLIKSGSYSYSLYIIHFPLLLLVYSVTQNWMGADLYRTIVVSCLAIILIVVIASFFSRYFENQKIFRPWILSVFSLLNFRSINMH